MNYDPILLLALLALHVAVTEWLVQNTPLSYIGTALLVIVLTAVSANLGLVPTYSDDNVVYQGIFTYIAPIGVFLLLLQVRLKEILKSGRSMLILFSIGSAGTFVGALVGMGVVNGSRAFGEHHAALAGMFVGTYTGGSVNYNAVALHYGIVKEGTLYAGATAVDSLMTTFWMAGTLLAPKVLRRLSRGRGSAARSTTSVRIDPSNLDVETVRPAELGWLTFLAAGCLAGSEWVSAACERSFGISVPSILILTTAALILAQVRPVQNLRGANALGMFTVYLFLAVIGALCDLGALVEIGNLGAAIALFAAILITVHAIFVFGLALWLRADPDVAAVASQAGIGGGTSALALARSLGRNDLTVPAILVGALGNALGTYLGFLTVRMLS